MPAVQWRPGELRLTAVLLGLAYCIALRLGWAFWQRWSITPSEQKAPGRLLWPWSHTVVMMPFREPPANHVRRTSVAVAISQRGPQSLQEDPPTLAFTTQMPSLASCNCSACKNDEQRAADEDWPALLCFSRSAASKPHPCEWYIILLTLPALCRRLSS